MKLGDTITTVDGKKVSKGTEFQGAGFWGGEVVGGLCVVWSMGLS